MKYKRFSTRGAVILLVGFFLPGIFGWPSPDTPGAASLIAEWPHLKFELYASGFERPIHITHASDGSGRLFVVEQSGQVRTILNGIVEQQPFLDISNIVIDQGEQGLLGLEFPPGYTEKGYFYVYYTRTDGNNQLSRFYLSADPRVADPDSEEEIMLFHHPDYINHNGGQLAFGPDGYLYISTGDGGGGGDPQENAQDLSSIMGKILRIDVESGANPYAIPASNPYTATVGALPEIWALGLRNPWRFSFDRGTGDLYIADVGQLRIEEINFQAAGSSGGQNYGWDIYEGSLCYEPPSGCSEPPNYVPPVAEYAHGDNNTYGCSVTGGYVYRGSAYPSMAGIYFYADYCSGRIFGLQKEAGSWVYQELLETPYTISTFGEDEAGNMFLADRAYGAIYQVMSIQAKHKIFIPILQTN